ncbi:gustatory receptor 23a-like [Teleopsis dalmanni]|uniref:gustatory receptor 23a-like n=1 Tax=Teleopsis dalmanni TaxID=139649 RepID=UPI0018CCC33C|nr:gustatory receptor 23a-like [Teleopsis dalmanni]
MDIRDMYPRTQVASLWAILEDMTAESWFRNKCPINSRNIGCLIFKLVKPLGNKRYNDLISEFSLQTLHQRFVITAKEFFNLNLNLLGSMVAAIVTYLVILIQFMLSEGTDQKLANTTVIPPIITNSSYNFSARKIIENVVTTVLTTDISERT